MRTRQLFLSSLIVLLSGLPAAAATYTVKGSGGSFTTIQACASAAVAGDTCEVYAGSYSGWTQSTNGSAGNPITFKAHTGDTVTITSTVTVTNRRYITIDGFRFTGQAINAVDGSGTTTSNIVFRNNTIVWSSSGSSSASIYLYGDRSLIENNEISGSGSDAMEIGGQNVVVRGNYFHDVNGSTSGEHIDFVQVIGGGTTPTLSFSLIENNVERNCFNDGGNCHFVIIRTGSGPVADTVIIRFNYAQNMDGSGVSLGGVGDNVPNARMYNNTIATGHLTAENGDCVSFQNAPNGVVLNNICYNTQANGWSPTISNAVGNGNIAFNTGYSGAWNSPYSTEETYATLRNKNPLFANFPTDGSLQAISPAIGAGVPLTTVAAGDSGTGVSMVVADARVFQPGWAGVQADWLRVGLTTTVQIASINYATNTITLASPISRSPGTPVYLYKDSNGQGVLFGIAPDIGAFPFGQAGSTPGTPTQVLVQ